MMFYSNGIIKSTGCVLVLLVLISVVQCDKPSSEKIRFDRIDDLSGEMRGKAIAKHFNMDILAASVSHGGSKKMMNIKVHRFMNGNEKELARFEYTIKNDGMILTTVEREKNHFSGTVQFHGKKGFRTRLPWEAKMDDISNRVSTGTVFTGIKKQQNQNWIFLKAWDEESIPAHSDPSLKKNVLNGDINAAIAVSVESKKAQN